MTTKIFHCSNTSCFIMSFIKVTTHFPYIKDAYTMIIWTSSHIICVEFAPIYCVYIVFMSFKYLRNRLFSVCSEIPKENVAINAYWDKLTITCIIFKSQVLDVTLMTLKFSIRLQFLVFLIFFGVWEIALQAFLYPWHWYSLILFGIPICLRSLILQLC